MAQIHSTIEIDENARIEPYVYGWMLLRRRKQREWEKKNGKKVGGGESWHTTYHTTPASALRALLLEAGRADSQTLEQYIERIETVFQKLEQVINKQGGKIHDTVYANTAAAGNEQGLENPDNRKPRNPKSKAGSALPAPRKSGVGVSANSAKKSNAGSSKRVSPSSAGSAPRKQRNPS